MSSKRIARWWWRDVRTRRLMTWVNLICGFAVGVVESDRMLRVENVHPGDSSLDCRLSGLRCNGYSLARKVFFEVAKRSLDAPRVGGVRSQFGR